MTRLRLCILVAVLIDGLFGWSKAVYASQIQPGVWVRGTPEQGAGLSLVLLFGEIIIFGTVWLVYRAGWLSPPPTRHDGDGA